MTTSPVLSICYSGVHLFRSMLGFMEDQAFSQSYDLTPPLSCLQPVSFSQYSRVSTAELTDGRGWGRSRIIRLEKAWFSVNHSILSGSNESRIFNIHEEIEPKSRNLSTNCSTW
jgi:hypothetical protein